MDEIYILERTNNCVSQTEYNYIDNFKNIVIGAIEFGELYFNQIDRGMRNYDPFNDIMKFLEMKYLNEVIIIKSELNFDPKNF